MNGVMQTLWQANIEISLLLIVILLARYAIRRTTKVYNAYLLWLSIPVGSLVARIVSQMDFSNAPVATVSSIVQGYIVQPAEAFDAWSFVGFLWAIVSGLLLCRLAYQHAQLRANLLRIKSSTPLEFGSSYTVIGINKKDFSPAVYGFFRPVIYFPVHLQKELTGEQIALIVLHEEQHIKQQHLWLNLLWDILVCIMWFNPLVYVSRQSFRHDQELFCDYLVLSKSTRQHHKSYGHALLSTVSATHSVSLLCSWNSFNQLEERIMNIKKPSSLSSKISLVVCSLAIIGCTSVYRVSAQPDTQTKSLQHEISDDGDTQIELVMDGKTYGEENGERFIVEDTGKRAMTKDEHRKFEQAMEQAKKEMEAAEREVQESEKEMHDREIEIEIKQIEAESTRREVELERQSEQLNQRIVELEIQEQEMALLPQKMQAAQQEIEKAQIEIEQSFESGAISEQHMREIQQELATARQEMIREQKTIELDAQQAQEEIKQVRLELQRERDGLTPPSAPKAGGSPEKPATPIDPQSPTSASPRQVPLATPI
ncbi:MAG: hypothetical protein HKN85_04590 [Gammaproteobacteria bacterium]|nr:hypothetical protein [Gammaproteobacteria bacterium]